MTPPIQPDVVLNVLFRAAGPDPRLATLHCQLGGKLDGKPIRRGDVMYGQASRVNFISIEIIGSVAKERAMTRLLAWLKQHRIPLRKLGAEKWIEVGCGLLPDQAYEQVRFPPNVLRALAEADCILVNTCYGIITNHDSMRRRRIA